MSTTVILGAGIIGVSTASYLAEHHQPGSTVHLVEAAPELFASASGLAAGFLARDWFPAPAAALGALSFDEHRRLADAEDGARNWGYAASTPVSLSLAAAAAGVGGREEREKERRVDVWCRDGASRAEAANGEPSTGAAPPWLKTAEGDVVEVISEEGTVAQVDPLKLCQHLLGKCLAAGVHLHHPARAVSAHTDAIRGELSGVRIRDTRSGAETDVPCTRVLVAAGAWSPRAFADLFPAAAAAARLPVSSLAGHSIVARSPRWAGRGEGESAEGKESSGCHAVFMAETPGYAPEIFSRADGSIYVAGLNSAAEPLPPLPTDAPARIRPEAIERLRGTARQVIVLGSSSSSSSRSSGDEGEGERGGEDDLEVVRQGLCFRPATARGTPILDRVPDAWLGPGVKTRPGADGGVYLAAGHGPWGISQSLGTGKVVAEMMQGKAPLSADVSGLGLPLT